MELKRVVVTGIGTINPLGKTIAEYWENLVKGVSGAAPITRFDASQLKTQFACEIKDYDPKEYFDRKELKKLDLFAQFALISTGEAIQDSGLDLESIDKSRVGVIWGSGIGGLETFHNEEVNIQERGQVKYSPFFIPKMILDIAAGHISIKYGFSGPNYATVSACSSSTHAIADAFNLIRLGKADIFVSGGSESAVNIPGVGGFNAMRAISTRNDEPKKASRPFDIDRDGFVIGEGGGSLILEEYEHAKKRGAKIYCELVGAGATGDAYHLTAPHPEGLGATSVMKEALREAGMQPEDIDYINVHGTSTPLGDIVEPLAILSVFGEHAYKLSISSTKSMTGHLLGAAGAVEAITSILAMKHNMVPPTINLDNLDPKIDAKLDFTPNKAKGREINAVLSNTFGFGGHNATIIFKRV